MTLSSFSRASAFNSATESSNEFAVIFFHLTHRCAQAVCKCAIPHRFPASPRASIIPRRSAQPWLKRGETEADRPRA